MTDRELQTNPFAVFGADEPRTGRYGVNGAQIHAEVRGRGPAVLIIGAASDDAEMFRPVAERLTGFTTITYDRRGTQRSSRDGWPCGSAQHADDAAALLRVLDFTGAHVFGASAGGIVAVQLALRHPGLVRRVLVYEPGYFSHSGSGPALRLRAESAVEAHLAARPGDWAGAMEAVSLAAQTADSAGGTQDPAAKGLLEAPAGMEWYAKRGNLLAENFVRDDMPLTADSVGPDALRASAADIRFAYGTASHPVFREIAEELTGIRNAAGNGLRAEAVQGAGHVAYYMPEVIADYIRRQCTGIGS